MKWDSELWTYRLIRCATFLFAFLPYRWIHAIGRCLGSVGFYLLSHYRKRTLSNLALATDLHLSHQELIHTAKLSFQNLAINMLEYAKFSRETHLSRVIQCDNPEIAENLYKKGQGIIFFCGHQSNWEALFLDGTSRMHGVAIGKSIHNKRLYQWILSIREKNGGQIIAPRNAIREGMRVLRKGTFLGIVGDQGMPDSNYSFPFLGRRAWTSTAPALLAYKTHSPLIFAETRRVAGGYRIHYSDPLWPDLSQPIETEVPRLMDRLLTLQQESIQRNPGEWLWQHNRWKQETLHKLYKRFRHDCISLILPQEESLFEELLPHLSTFKEIYPRAFLSLFVPYSKKGSLLIPADEIHYYHTPQETLPHDLRFKLIFNFTPYRWIHTHYTRLSAFEVIDIPSLRALAAPHLTSNPSATWSDIFKRALCRPGSLWK